MDKKTFDEINALLTVKALGENAYSDFIKTFGVKKTEAYRLLEVLKKAKITA